MGPTAWIHDLNPFAVELWQGVGIRWYGLAYLAGFVVAFFLIRRVLRRGTSTLDASAASELVFALAMGAVVGGRLGYVAFYRPSLLWTFSSSPPFWEALAINHGGMASHGGMIGVVVAAAIFAYRRRVQFLHVLDLAAFAAPIGLFFGRVANFVNGELYGRPAPASLPWAVKFPQEIFNYGSAQLAELRQRLVDAGVGALSPDEVLAHVRAHDITVIDAIAPMLTARHPSQIYEALLEGLFVFAVLALVWLKPRRAGTVAAAFAFVYGAVRIFGEQFRLPDAPVLNVGALDITRGQLLSTLLLAGGALVAFFAHRHREKLGGWRLTRAQPTAV